MQSQYTSSQTYTLQIHWRRAAPACREHFALFSCSSFGTSGGDKRNARHSDPVPLRHELGQGWSAAKPNPDAIINTLLQPRPYLQNSEGNMSK
jgi:hypothetical protein